MTTNVMLEGLTYTTRTFGCQMNLSDTEKIWGLLDAHGMVAVQEIEDAEVVIYVTCCIREAADTRLFGQINSMKNLTLPPSGRRIVALGGCIAQRDREALLDKLEHVDIVFGTHTLSDLPALIRQALTGQRGIKIEEASQDLQFNLPIRREHPYHAWLPIITGCNNFCSYCIVPHVRGREHSYSFDGIVQQARLLADDGVQEVTLLGQNVNSYGRDRYGHPRFAELLYALGETGIPRIRFVTSHPKDLLPETIQAIGDVKQVMPALHLAVQSGSDAILSKMNRGYTCDKFLRLVDTLRNAVPSIALSTDVIVGFPGETQQDFNQTLSLVQEVGFSQAFTFIFSPRDGTPAAKLSDDTPHEIIQERFDQLVLAVQESAHAFNQPFTDKTIDVFIEGTSKRDASVLTGRSPHDQTVHVAMNPKKRLEDYLGKILPVHIEKARTWYLSGSLTEIE